MHKNADAVACKLRLALTRAINYKLEVVKVERQKREKMVKKQKAEIMTIKRYKAKRGMSLSSKKEDESDIADDINSD